MGRMERAYYNWIIHLVCPNRYDRGRSRRTLLRKLHDTEFVYILDMDANRAEYGIDLRYRFAYENNWTNEELHENLDTERHCSMLEMMAALAIHCEESIMCDPDLGDRTHEWFLAMLKSLGLGDIHEHNYDEDYVEFVLDRFMRMEYDEYGRGGLFTFKEPKPEIHQTDIWYQMMWWLAEMEG